MAISNSELLKAQRECQMQANAQYFDAPELKYMDRERDKARNYFSALRAYKESIAAFNINKKTLSMFGPTFWNEMIRLKDSVMEDDNFYSEFLHGNIISPFYTSRDAYRGELLWKLGNMIMEYYKPYGIDPYMNIYNVVRAIRNDIILENWNKYRKAYIFDRELEKAFLASKSDDISFCAKMIDYLPFNTIYVKFPEDSELSEYYDGVFASVRRSDGFLYIEENNLASYENMARMMKFKDSEMENGKPDLLMAARDRAEKAIKGFDDFVSLHLVLVNKTPDPGQGTSYTFYTYMQPFPYDPDDGEGGMCHTSEDEIKQKLRGGEFEHRAHVRRIVIFILNAFMYLSAKNADIQTRLLKTDPPAPAKKGHPVTVMKPVELNECGFVYGKAVREIEKRKKEGIIGDDEIEVVDVDGHLLRMRKPPSPHPICAHTQRYHVGKGRKDVIWKWIPPGYAGIGKGNVNVSRVEDSKTDG